MKKTKDSSHNLEQETSKSLGKSNSPASEQDAANSNNTNLYNTNYNNNNKENNDNASSSKETFETLQHDLYNARVDVTTEASEQASLKKQKIIMNKMEEKNKPRKENEAHHLLQQAFHLVTEHLEEPEEESNESASNTDTDSTSDISATSSSESIY